MSARALPHLLQASPLGVGLAMDLSWGGCANGCSPLPRPPPPDPNREVPSVHSRVTAEGSEEPDHSKLVLECLAKRSPHVSHGVAFLSFHREGGRALDSGFAYLHVIS